MKDIKIGVAYHKEAQIIRNECYIPIHVGKSIHSDVNLEIQCDNDGDNISEKNDYYCELTALYWIWKNIKADYKGLCHYRRFFSYKKNWRYRFYKYLRPIQSLRNHLYFNSPSIMYHDARKFENDAYRTLNVMDRLLEKYDIICSTKNIENRSSYWHFAFYGMEIMDIIRFVIEKDYPSYYKYIQYIESPSSFHYGNMSVMRNDFFEEYCSFLFDVLAKTEKLLLQENYYIDLHREKSFERKLGYFAEYLTDLYIRKKKSEKIKVKELDVAFLK